MSHDLPGWVILQICNNRNGILIPIKQIVICSLSSSESLSIDKWHCLSDDNFHYKWHSSQIWHGHLLMVIAHMINSWIIIRSSMSSGILRHPHDVFHQSPSIAILTFPACPVVSSSSSNPVGVSSSSFLGTPRTLEGFLWTGKSHLEVDPTLDMLKLAYNPHWLYRFIS